MNDYNISAKYFFFLSRIWNYLCHMILPFGGKKEKETKPTRQIIIGRQYLKIFNSYRWQNLGEFNFFLCYLSVFPQFHTLKFIYFIYGKVLKFIQLVWCFSTFCSSSPSKNPLDVFLINPPWNFNATEMFYICLCCDSLEGNKPLWPLDTSIKFRRARINFYLHGTLLSLLKIHTRAQKPKDSDSVSLG